MRKDSRTVGNIPMRCGCGFTTLSTSAFFDHKAEERAKQEPWPKSNGLRPTKSNPNRHLDPRAAMAASDTKKSRKHQARQRAIVNRWRDATGKAPKRVSEVPPMR